MIDPCFVAASDRYANSIPGGHGFEEGFHTIHGAGWRRKPPVAHSADASARRRKPVERNRTQMNIGLLLLRLTDGLTLEQVGCEAEKFRPQGLCFLLTPTAPKISSGAAGFEGDLVTKPFRGALIETAAG